MLDSELNFLIYLHLWILYSCDQYFYRCFFVDNATKSNVTVDTCPVLLIINQPSKLNSKTTQNWTHDSTKEAENYVSVLLLHMYMYFTYFLQCFYVMLMNAWNFFSQPKW